MKVGLNATCLNDRPSGAKQRFIGIYGELVKRLPEVEFVVYEPVDCRVGEWFHGAPNVSLRRTPLQSDQRISKFLGGLNYWRTALPKEKFDLFEGFNIPLVKVPIGKTILTIHDIRGLQSEYGVLRRTAFRAVIGNSLARADHVITVSEAMRQEILSFYPGTPISVVYNGLDTGEFDTVIETDLQTTRRKYQLPQEFVLAVGHYEKRKNYLRLIDAMERLHDRGSLSNLVLIGNDNGERKLIEERIRSANLSGQVQVFSSLSDLEIRCFYKFCSLFVFPSSYEGFGIPILEAMAAGCPMVLSDMPVFREITQDMGVYFAHDDTEAMASAIEKVLTSNSECARLIAYGKERVKDFSFQNLAGQIEQLYQS